MAARSRNLLLVQKLRNNGTHTIALHLPSKGAKAEYHLQLESTTDLVESDPRIAVSSQPDANHTAAAVLYCYRTSVTLQGIQSNVYVKGTNWTSDSESEALGTSDTESGSLEKQSSRIKLRPNDVFCIDETEILIQLDDNAHSQSPASTKDPSMPDPDPLTPCAALTSPSLRVTMVKTPSSAMLNQHSPITEGMQQQDGSSEPEHTERNCTCDHAVHGSHLTPVDEHHSDVETDDSPEKAPKRVKFAASHVKVDTAGASNDAKADFRMDEERSEADTEAKPETEKVVTLPRTTDRRSKKKQSAASEPNPETANHETEETTVQAPDLRSTSPVKTSSPNTRKKAAMKEAAVSQHTPKLRKSPTTPEAPVDPSSSKISTRSAARNTATKLQGTSSEVRVLFASSTNVDKSKAFMKFLTAQGVQKATSIDDCTVLCIGKDAELKKTSNLVLAVLSGKDIVTDNWISASASAKKLLDIEEYRATDPEREEEWGISLTDAIARNREGLQPFSNSIFGFTSAVKSELGKGFADMKSICLKAGAKSIMATIPRKGPQEPYRTIMIATSNDKDAGFLQRNGWTVYTKDLITLSVLRGTLQIESEEFVIEGQTPPSETGTSKGKKRKR